MPTTSSRSLDQSFSATEAHPLVSVIMPAYNVAQYISQTLDSVFAQSYQRYEIIVVNDGSPDSPELERVLEPYQSRIIYLKQANRGLSGARNTAIRAAHGELIALLDPDDIWEPNYLEVQVGKMVADPSIDVLYPNALLFGDAAESGKKYMDICPSVGEVTFESLVRRQCNVFISVTARLEAIMRAGMFDEHLRSVEDFDLWLRIVKSGGRIAYHREVLVRYRKRSDSLSADPVWLMNHANHVFEKARDNFDLSEDEKNILDGELANVQASVKFHEGRKAFFRGEIRPAIDKLTEANVFFRSRKTKLFLLLLRIAPRLSLWLYNLRDNLIFKANTKY